MINQRNKNSVRNNITGLVTHAKRSSSRASSWLTAKDLPSSFKYAAQGISYSFFSQRNFRIHIFTGGLVSAFGLWLQLPFYSLAILALTIAAVLVLELINTSIEAVVDLSIGRRFHPLARIAKDCSAAAVLIASLSSVVVAVFLLFPLLSSRLGL